MVVGAELDRERDRLLMAPFGGPDQRRPAVGDLSSSECRTGLGEPFHDTGVAIAGREHRGGVTALVVEMDIRPGPEQAIYRLEPTELGGEHHRCPLTEVAWIDLARRLERRDERPCLTDLGQSTDIGFVGPGISGLAGRDQPRQGDKDRALHPLQTDAER